MGQFFLHNCNVPAQFKRDSDTVEHFQSRFWHMVPVSRIAAIPDQLIPVWVLSVTLCNPQTSTYFTQNYKFSLRCLELCYCWFTLSRGLSTELNRGLEMIILWCWLAARASNPSLEHYKVEYGVRPHTIPELWAYVWTFDHHWQRSLNAVPSSVWCIALCDFNTLSMMNLLLGCQCEFCCHHLRIRRMSRISVSTARSRYVRVFLYVVLLLLFISVCIMNVILLYSGSIPV